MTYAQALAELQQRSIDALKVATNAQLASIEASRDIARTLTAPAPIAAAFGPMTTVTTAFTFALLEQQLTYAKHVSEAFAGKSVPVSAPAVDAHAAIPVASAAAPLAVIETPEPLALPALVDEPQRDIEVRSKTLPAPSGKLPAPPRASGFAAKSKTVPSVSNAKQPKRGTGKG